MILVELELENYKQYAGNHLIEFPSEGAVAIIGNNGVGKTTLFEAIEWCLYNPREIPNDELPPRGGVGDTRVKLTLEDPRDLVRYVIERTRRRRGVDAEIYLLEQPESPIVKGTRDVTEYVTQRLIGFGHRAFVSTFFTRQKELTFFGGLRDTERRREVAHLLGFETIRSAQAIIGEDRTSARNDYQVLARQYEDEIKDRDLAAELTAADLAIAVATAAEQVALRALEASELSLQSARQELERWTALERQHADLSQQLERLTGELRTAEADQRHATNNLNRLAKLEQARQNLLPFLKSEPGLRARLAVHETELERSRHAQLLTSTIQRAQAVIDEVPGRVKSVVQSVDTTSLSLGEWSWAPADTRDPESALDRLVSLIDGMEPDRESQQADDLRMLVQAIAVRDEARAKADKYAERLAIVQCQLEQLLAASDPRSEIARVEQLRSETQLAARSAIDAERRYAKRVAEVQQTIVAIEAAAREPECPTCHRPLSPQDAKIAIAPLRAQIEDLDRQRQDARAEADSANSQLARFDQELSQVKGQLTEVQDLERRHATGTELVAETGAEAARRDEASRLLLVKLNLSREPTQLEASEALRLAHAVKAIAGQRTILVTLRDQLARSTTEHAAAADEAAALGPVSYDPDAHRATEQSLGEAVSAIARLAQIDLELANRESYETQCATAQSIAGTITTALATVAVRRDQLHFDRVELDQVAAAERAAAIHTRDADRAVSTARGQLHAAIRDREATVLDQLRVANLARRSEVRRREYDELERMYREFDRFDQYVAQLVTPQLADYTGELLAEVTDHKYDQVSFDDNYGIRIYDGPEDFPLEQFSGGERDVAALCARLALSRFIGAQAAHPPRFLVLDEVFGSLDTDRRTHVLGALLKLAGNDGPFRQLFIISHVDDVRLSPSLDEIWRVHEIDGASKVENVSRSGQVDEL